MKRLYTLLTLSLACAAAQAQPILSNGFGSLALIDGATYSKATTIGTGNFSNVTASPDGQYFYASGTNATAGKIYYVSVATSTIVDSLVIPAAPVGDIAAGTNAQYLLVGKSSGLYRINPATKAIDSIGTPGSIFRMEMRPGTTEAWMTIGNTIQVVDYASSPTLSITLGTGGTTGDNTEMRFTPGGSTAWKAVSSLQKIYKIDANTKAIVDSINTAPYSIRPVEVSTDSTMVYGVVGGGQVVYRYSAASKMLVDSMVATKLIMNLYRHPTRPELWAVHHFSDSVTVFSETTGQALASFDIGNDPFFLAFSTGTTRVGQQPTAAAGFGLYPNPTTCLCHFTLGSVWNLSATTITVVDVQGRSLRSTRPSAPLATIDMSALAPGVYFIHVTDGTSSHTARVVKQ